MSKDTQVATLKTALSGSQGTSVLIHGDWGVGKTHHWNMYLENQEKSTKESKPISITCFGAKSIDEIKQRIFFELINQFDKKDLKEFGKTENIRRGLPAILFTLFRSQSKTDTIVEITLEKLKNRTICLDDIERKHECLELIELFGYVELLQFQYKATLVCIINLERLNEGDKNVYREMGEKIFDRSIKIGSPQMYNLKNSSDKSLFDKEYLAHCFNKLGITNMRSVLRTKRLVENIIDILVNEYQCDDTGLLRETIASTTLLYCSKHHASEAFPNIEFILGIDDYKRGKRAYQRIKGRAEDNDIEWFNVLDEYSSEWFKFSDLDAQIIHFMEYGYFDRIKMAVVIDKYNSRNEEKNRNIRLSRTWDRYHSNFNDDPDLMNDFYESSIEALPNTLPRNLDAVIGILRTVGELHKADSLIVIYLRYLKDHDTAKISREYFYDFGPLEDCEFNDAAEKAINEAAPTLSLSEVLGKKMTGHATPEEEEVIADANRNDFFETLKELDTSATETAANILSRLKREPQLSAALAEFEASLVLLGEESGLNKRRVESVYKNSALK